MPISEAQSRPPFVVRRAQRQLGPLTDTRLSSTARLLYAILEQLRDRNGVISDVKDDDLADMIGVHWGSVQRAKRELKKAGVIECSQQGRGRPLRYVLTAIALALLTATSVPTAVRSTMETQSSAARSGLLRPPNDDGVTVSSHSAAASSGPDPEPPKPPIEHMSAPQMTRVPLDPHSGVNKSAAAIAAAVERKPFFRELVELGVDPETVADLVTNRDTAPVIESVLRRLQKRGAAFRKNPIDNIAGWLIVAIRKQAEQRRSGQAFVHYCRVRRRSPRRHDRKPTAAKKAAALQLVLLPGCAA